jgi:hypothetical protein
MKVSLKKAVSLFIFAVLSCVALFEARANDGAHAFENKVERNFQFFISDENESESQSDFPFDKREERREENEKENKQGENEENKSENDNSLKKKKNKTVILGSFDFLPIFDVFQHTKTFFSLSETISLFSTGHTSAVLHFPPAYILFRVFRC